MKIFFWCCLNLLAWFSKAQPAASDIFFDPRRDPVAQLATNGRMRCLLNGEVLVRSISVKLPQIGEVGQIACQTIEGRWWLTLESRHADDLEQSVFVALRLKPGENGNYFADSYWTACTGEGCGGCDFKHQMDGCFCRYDKPGEPGTPGACYQTASNEPLLAKVALK